MISVRRPPLGALSATASSVTAASLTAPVARRVRFARRLFRAAIVLSFVPLRAFAQDASNWDTQSHSAARLIAGAMSKDHDIPFLRAGVEIRLDPGWQTYWRDPGDSGAPPSLDFSASENVKAVNVLWPAPERFPDGAGGNSVGYRDHVILPLHVVPAEATKQTALRLKLAYDICSNICIPAEADLVLQLGDDGAQEAAIAQAELRVPRPVALGQQVRPAAAAERGTERAPAAGAQGGAENTDRRNEPLAILALHREPGDAHDRVVVDVEARPGAPVDLYVEGPTPDWSLPLPRQSAADGVIRHFEFELEGLPPNAKADGAALTLTAVSGDDAIEVRAHLD
jgi:DsbC/DsbD-like thiol-disulfide interchange protein